MWYGRVRGRVAIIVDYVYCKWKAEWMGVKGGRWKRSVAGVVRWERGEMSNVRYVIGAVM